MSKPYDIPKDVMKAAAEVVVSLGIGGTTNPNPDGFAVRDAVARAILAERERCALEALGVGMPDPDPYDEFWSGWNQALDRAAHVIRHPQETTNGL